MRRLAVIDMGSNSFRLVVYGYEPEVTGGSRRDPRGGPRVGRHDATGELSRSDQAGGARPRSCCVVLRASGIDDVRAVATSAIRDARNRDELLRRLGLTRACCRPRTRRATATWRSPTRPRSRRARAGHGRRQRAADADRGPPARAQGSWPLGAVRVSEPFLPDDEATKKVMKALRKHVAKTRCAWLPTASGSCGVGGTVRNLAAAAQKRADLPAPGRRGLVPDARGARDLIEELGAMPPAKRGSVPGIKPDRGDVILGGALVLGAVMETRGFDASRSPTPACARASSSSASSTTATRRWSTTCAARRSATWRAATRTTSAHPTHVARAVAAAARRPAEVGLVDVPTPSERDLLWAACMLHDIGTAVDYDDHHKHSRYLILNGGPARLHAARARADRADRPLPPKGRAGRVRARPARAQEGRRAAGPAVGDHPPGRAARAHARPARSPPWRSTRRTTARCACAPRRYPTTPSRCGRRAAPRGSSPRRSAARSRSWARAARAPRSARGRMRR